MYEIRIGHATGLSLKDRTRDSTSLYHAHCLSPRSCHTVSAKTKRHQPELGEFARHAFKSASRHTINEHASR